MSSILFELVVILILIFLNGILAMAEISVVSSRKARLQQQVEEGNDKAMAALKLAKDPADFLSTVQIGITLVGVMAGAFGGATIAQQLALLIDRAPLLAPYSQVVSVGLVVLVITYLTLIIGELVPKRLGLIQPEKTAMRFAAPMQRISRLASPLVRFLSLSSDVVLRLIGAKPSQDPPVTEEEIKVLIDQGTRAGVFEVAEQDMVEAIFRLADRRVGVLMTPRTEVVWLDLEDPWEQTLQKIGDRIHSRFPVAHGDLDSVIGMVQAKDLLAGKLLIEPQDLEAALSQPLYVPESMLALQALELFREARVHAALVIDEYGGLQGLVTIFDILRSIVGEMPEIGSLSELEIVHREDGTLLLDGMLPIDEFKDFFNLQDLPGEGRGYFQTLGGFIMTQLGRIPSATDRVEWENLCLEVVDMDGMRVDKVLVSLGDGRPCETENNEAGSGGDNH